MGVEETVKDAGGSGYWGLPLPAFLVIYVGLVLLPIVVRLVGPRLLEGRAGAPHRTPGPAELGFLAGGPMRATDAALADLVERQQVRVSYAGRLTTTGDRPPADELGAAVWASVHHERGAATLHTVRAALRDGIVLDVARDRLAEAGLLVEQGPLKNIRRLAAVLMVAVAIVAFTSFPSGGFVLALAPAAILWAVTGRPGARPPRTRTGDEVVRSASGTSAAHAVALGGLTRYPDRDIAAALSAAPAPRPQKSRGWASSSGSSWGGASSCGSSSSCSSSCGGNSCGGGSSCGGSSCGGSSCGGGGCGGG
ncbi:TIGR04222 domain-containing membrane protein [Amycolatopsis granulosa]|uniref:TIGR04222 domain-containing membrane protein n=1 Tax=Amycolatopsis granulosa TaxID=185684 RepID=UPI001FB93A4A|nr:TIGR04222 domain-containing membrane protein [Amycolatopsis granulosa]NIH88218.1 uncharacterized protein (TIGR04222 family) [Amycolatopsis granulosa]